jgi:hypothetical protein
MKKVDIEVLKKLNYEDGKKLLIAAGYDGGDQVTDVSAGLADFVRDEYWRLFDEDADEIADVITWTEYFNIIKYNPGDLNDEEIVRAGWEHPEYDY